jgi:hypothetical protein
MITSVLAITGIFFVIGIAVGVIAVIAMSALRRHKRNRPDDWPGPDRPASHEPAPDLERESYLAEKGSWWKAHEGS